MSAGDGQAGIAAGVAPDGRRRAGHQRPGRSTRIKSGELHAERVKRPQGYATAALPADVDLPEGADVDLTEGDHLSAPNGATPDGYRRHVPGDVPSRLRRTGSPWPCWSDLRWPMADRRPGARAVRARWPPRLLPGRAGAGPADDQGARGPEGADRAPPSAGPCSPRCRRNRIRRGGRGGASGEAWLAGSGGQCRHPARAARSNPLPGLRRRSGDPDRRRRPQGLLDAVQKPMAASSPPTHRRGYLVGRPVAPPALRRWSGHLARSVPLRARR